MVEAGIIRARNVSDGSKKVAVSQGRCVRFRPVTDVRGLDEKRKTFTAKEGRAGKWMPIFAFFVVKINWRLLNLK